MIGRSTFVAFESLLKDYLPHHHSQKLLFERDYPDLLDYYSLTLIVCHIKRWRSCVPCCQFSEPSYNKLRENNLWWPILLLDQNSNDQWTKLFWIYFQFQRSYQFPIHIKVPIGLSVGISSKKDTLCSLISPISLSHCSNHLLLTISIFSSSF